MKNIEYDPEFYIREAYRIRSQFFADALKFVVATLKKPFASKPSLATKAEVVTLKKATPTGTEQQAA